MLTLSKSLSASQAQTYHKLDFASETQSYYRQGDTVQGEWQGQLTTRFGLSGAVTPLEFQRLSEGLHPDTEAPMVRSRAAFEYKNADGETIKTVEHRAGWDATFSAPKSVSLTALVGGDDRVREAHRAAVSEALNELERYTQARIGGNHPAETTGKFIAAKFEHDTARPVDGYAAPQLHTHAVVFNVTERADGSTRALQPHSLFESQQYATAVYQSELMYRLRNLGYEIESGKSGAPEIKGYTQEYLDASSPRSRQIREQLEKTGRAGSEAAEIAAHSTRDRNRISAPNRFSTPTGRWLRSSATRPNRSLQLRGSASNSRRSDERAAPRPKKPSPSLARASSRGRQSSMSAESCATPYAGGWERQRTGRFARSSRFGAPREILGL